MIILIEKECIIMERFKRFLSEMLDYTSETYRKVFKVLMIILMTESIALVTLLLLYYLYSLG